MNVIAHSYIPELLLQLVTDDGRLPSRFGVRIFWNFPDVVKLCQPKDGEDGRHELIRALEGVRREACFSDSEHWISRSCHPFIKLATDEGMLVTSNILLTYVHRHTL